jgi:hypothetical protein
MNFLNFISFITLSHPELRDSTRSEFGTRIRMRNLDPDAERMFEKAGGSFCNAGGFS